jgi:hypothetical protein
MRGLTYVATAKRGRKKEELRGRETYMLFASYPLAIVDIASGIFIHSPSGHLSTNPISLVDAVCVLEHALAVPGIVQVLPRIDCSAVGMPVYSYALIIRKVRKHIPEKQIISR